MTGLQGLGTLWSNPLQIYKVEVSRWIAGEAQLTSPPLLPLVRAAHDILLAMCLAGVEFRDFQAPESLRLVSHMLREHYQAADALASFGADGRTEQLLAHSKLGSAFAQRHLQLPSKLSAGSVFCMGPPLAAIGRFEAAPTIWRKPTMTNCCLSGWNMAIIDIAIDRYLPVRPRRQYLSTAYSVVTSNNWLLRNATGLRSDSGQPFWDSIESLDSQLS